MYNNNRSYIYNKAFYEAFFNPKHKLAKKLGMPAREVFKYPTSSKALGISDRFEQIRQWAEDRGIYAEGNSHTQYVKLMEEAGELAAALLNKDPYEVKDAIGDMVVVLTNLAALEGMQIENCIDAAYNEIANRTGVMQNGTFVKTGTTL